MFLIHCIVFTVDQTFLVTATLLVAWRGVVVCAVSRMNEVNARRARLVPGWVTVFGPIRSSLNSRKKTVGKFDTYRCL